MLSRIKRILKHGWLGAVPTGQTIAPELVHKLTQAVSASERRHSGEIRIYVETSLPLGDLWRTASMRQLTRARAVMLFGQLRVWDTAHNNGVLIYLLLAERAIEVVADRGLNAVVEPQVWQAMVARMGAAFRNGQFEEGLSEALAQVSDLLAQHFALAPGEVNPNELPDAPLLR
jgi:uncharacterized membrane protein